MKTPSFSSGLQLMFTPQAFVPFVLGSLALAIIGNSGYQLLINKLGTGDWVIAEIGAGALLVLVGAAWTLSRVVGRWGPAPRLIGKRQPDKRKGLILLVSNEPTSRRAVEWHNGVLKYCWLFCSTQSGTIAQKLKEEMTGQGQKAELVLIDDVFDPIEFRNKVENIYARLPVDCLESDVILDFTGMTACASVGSVLACLPEKRSIQYTPGQYDTTLKVLRPLDPVEVVLTGVTLRQSIGTDEKNS